MLGFHSHCSLEELINRIYGNDSEKRRVTKAKCLGMVSCFIIISLILEMQWNNFPQVMVCFFLFFSLCKIYSILFFLVMHLVYYIWNMLSLKKMCCIFIVSLMTQGQILSVYKQVQLSLRSILFMLIYVKTEIGPEHICKNLSLFLVDSVFMHH